MNLKRKDIGRTRGSAKDKLNAIALRGVFILGAACWAMTGEFLIGMLAAVLAAVVCFVSGEMR